MENRAAKYSPDGKSFQDRFYKFDWRYVWLYGTPILSLPQYLTAAFRGRKSKPEGRMLELSSGTLPYNRLLRRDHTIVATDIDRVQLKRQRALSKLGAKILRRESKKQFVVLDNSVLPFAPNSFSKIVAINGFDLSFEEVSRVLVEGGMFIESFMFDSMVYIKGDGLLLRK